MAVALAGASCQTVAPGPPYTVPSVQFNPNYFYCVVEPEIIMGGLTGTPCGDNGSHGCHYSDKIPAFPLVQLEQPVTCSGSGITAVPTNMSQVAEGTPAQLNLGSCSEEMNSVYMEAPLYTRPSSNDTGVHPVQVFSSSNTKISNIYQTWAMQ
jgi:hypothetical protein